MSQKAKILFKEFVTHDVKRFIIEKPADFKFNPGQAVDISLNIPGWENYKQPFTFTSSNKDLVLEFTIKGYPQRNRVTKHLHEMIPGEEIILHDIFGTIQYKGRGIFLAAGAGITPFIAILRHLRDTNNLKGNYLIFSNKTKEDVILEKEFKNMFEDMPKNLVFTLSREKQRGYEFGHIDEKILKKHIKTLKKIYFYMCGPDAFVDSMKEIVKKLGGKPESIVFEE